ncbi:hypothetical protein CRYUN_Cryun12cG0159800 [Craigia yunnanensis]
MSRDNGLTQPPMQNVIASNSIGQSNTHPHIVPFSQQLLGNKMQTFPGDSLPQGGPSNSSSYESLFTSATTTTRFTPPYG